MWIKIVYKSRLFNLFCRQKNGTEGLIVVVVFLNLYVRKSCNYYADVCILFKRGISCLFLFFVPYFNFMIILLLYAVKTCRHFFLREFFLFLLMCICSISTLFSRVIQKKIFGCRNVKFRFIIILNNNNLYEQ